MFGRSVAAAGLAALVALGACATGEQAAAPAPSAPAPTAAATTPPTSAAPTSPPPTTLPPTTPPPTTASPTTLPATTAAPTTLPPTTAAPTTTIALPIPVAPPLEDGTLEPEVLLGGIEIPALGLNRPLSEGIRLHTLDRGPGHWPGTALPGQIGNVVVAGHRVSHQADFRDLDRLVPGDEVIFTIGPDRFVYHVRATEIVGPEALWIVDQTAATTGTLFACHPPGSTRERIVVYLDHTP